MDNIKLEFSVTSQTKLGQQIYICGNVQVLGNWNPINSFKLYTDQTIYPQWKSSVPIFVKSLAIIQFKACILDTNKNLIKWESLIGNRNISPQQNSTVCFEINKPFISFCAISPPICQRIVTQIIPFRKGTQQILVDLDQYSDSSSGNERRWSQMNTFKQRKATMLMNLFLQEVNNTFQKPSSTSHIENKYEENQKYYNLIQDVIVLPSILPLQQNYQNIQRQHLHKKSQEHIQTISQSYFFKDRFKKSKLRFYVYHFLYSHQKKYLFQQKSFSNMYMYHLNKKQKWEGNQCQNIIQSLLKISQFNIICTNEDQKIMKIVQYCRRKSQKYQLKMINERVIKIYTKQKKFIHLIFCQLSIQFNSCFRKKNNLVDFKNLYQKIHLFLPATFKSQMFQDISHFKDINKRKRCLIVRAFNFNQISQQIIKDLIGISSRKNIEVYLHLCQQCKNIKTKIPIAETNKFLVISSYGDIMCCDGKIQNFLKSFYINQQKFNILYESLLQKIQIWKDQIISKSIHINTLQIMLKNNTFSFLIIQFLKTQVKKLNQTSRFKYVIQQFQQSQQIQIILKPQFLSDNFLSKVIAAMNQQQIHQPQIILFDYSRHRQKFINFSNLLKNICTLKGMKFQGFHIDKLNKKYQSINQDLMYQILLIIDQAAQNSLTVPARD